MKNKQIEIVTYCSWTSLGSILQSFALSKTLNGNGYPTTILLEDWNRMRETQQLKNWKDFMQYFYKKALHKKIETAYKKRLNFIDANIGTKYLKQYDEFVQRADLNTDGIYLAGSDQIWHPDRCDKHFFLEFVRSGKCISYAASMGKTEIPPENVDKFRQLMQRLDRISVREIQCRDVLQPLTEKNIDVHIDPTFLMETDTWRQYEKPYPVREPYILVYMIYWHPSCKAQLQELKRRTGLPVYAVCSGLSRVYADKKLFDVGVEEFLWLVDHAEYVVTSSFHGAAMSTIFGKKFATVVNPGSPSRIRNLLQTLGIPEVPIHKLDTTNLFDYETIRTRIADERNKGMQYLEEAVDE